MIDTAFLHSRIAARAEDYLRELFGDSFKPAGGGKWRVGKRGSLAVSIENNVLVFYSHEEGSGGDAVALWQRERGGTAGEALRAVAAWAGFGEEVTAPATVLRRATATDSAHADNPDWSKQWQACVTRATDERLELFTAERGLSPGFLPFARQRGWIGIFNSPVHGDCIAFPVADDAGVIVACHYRTANRQWRYEPTGRGTHPLIIGDLTNANQVHVFESQWDAFDMLDKFREFDASDVAVIVTRGAANGALVAGHIRPDTEVFAWPQNDPEDKRDLKTGKTPAEKWLTTVAKNAGALVRSVLTSADVKDLSDWGRTGATADDYLAAIGASKIIARLPRPLIEFRSPSQLKSFVPPPGMMLVGDCHIVRGAVFVIAGAPGVGKSRAGVGLAVAGATGFDWFGLKVHRKFKTLIIQNENGEFRLSKEFADLDCETLDPWVRVCPPPPFGLCFNREEFRAVLARVIAEFQPDVILLDPWNAVAGDDKAKDYLEAFELIRSVIPAGDDAPALGIVAHTRKPKSDERASGRALLNLLAGSYVLGSVPRCVFIVQAASDDPEDNRVVWTCCKNNDGELGARSAWKRANGLFAPVAEFDWEEFDNPNKDERVTITEMDMQTVFDGGAKRLTKPEARDALKKLTGAGRSAAYAALDTKGRFASRLSESKGVLSWK